MAPSLLDKSLREGWQLRFIEHMPLGAQAWSRQAIVSAQRILDIFAANGFELTELGRPDRRPAQLWQVAPTATRPGGTVGIIASITRPFCDDCDRTRLTADGQLMTCLFAQAETDLRALLRGGASDEEIASAWQQATWFKPLAHGRDAGPNAQPLNVHYRRLNPLRLKNIYKETMQITVRYFAGAAQAAATTSESVEISPGTTLEQLLAQLSQRSDELARVLAASSYLINSRPVTDRSSVLDEGINLDVLPPFAGG